MIQLRHAQRCVWEGLFAEEVEALWEPWMQVVDELLEDEELLPLKESISKVVGQKITACTKDPCEGT